MSNNYEPVENNEEGGHQSIKTEPDFFLSNLLNKHGVEPSESIQIA